MLVALTSGVHLQLPEQYYRPAPWQKWKLPVYVALLAVSVYVGSTYSGPFSGAVSALVMLFGALQYIGIFGLMHESAHGHLSRRRKVNRVIGELMSVLVGTSYAGYRYAHLAHHAAFRTERDPQEILFPRRSTRETAGLLLVAALIGAPIFLLLRAPLISARRKGIVYALSGPVLAVLLYGTLAFQMPSKQWHFLAWTILTAWVFGSMNDIVYHQGLDAGDSLTACTSFDSDVFGQLFLSGANRHAEHHAYPAVPGPRLVGLARIVRSDFAAQGVPYERSFTHAFVRRLIVNPLFLPTSRRDDDRWGQ